MRQLRSVLSSLAPALLLAMAAALLCRSPAFADDDEQEIDPKQLPKRLVLCVDGVAFGDIVEAQRDRGQFQDFFPASRNISTFPSLSDLAWSDIFQTRRPDGYNRFHYSVGANQVVGGALTELGFPAEFEQKMHVAFQNPLHHSLAYISPEFVAVTELNDLIDGFMHAKSETFYAYMVGTDTVQHTGGMIDEILRLVDTRLTKLQSHYQKLTGRKLEIVMLSDHGNTHTQGTSNVDFDDFMEEHGYHVRSSIQDEMDVAQTSAGVISVMEIYSKESQVVKLARVLTGMEGVELVTYVAPGEKDLVHVLDDQGHEAAILHRKGGFAYRAIQGDPLGYADFAAVLRANGKSDADGYASGDDWLAISSGANFPAALERIYRGHFEVTLNPSRILVSLKRGYGNANTLVGVLQKFQRPGGTHGALAAADSDGIFLTNFKETQDVTTNRVAAFLGGFLDMRDYRKQQAGGQFVDSKIVGYDDTRGVALDSVDNLSIRHTTFLNLWDPKMPELLKTGVKTVYKIDVETGGWFSSNTVSEREFQAETLPHTAEFREFRIPTDLIVPGPLDPQGYQVTVTARRLDPQGEVLDEEKLFRSNLLTDADGEVIAY